MLLILVRKQRKETKHTFSNKLSRDNWTGQNFQLEGSQRVSGLKHNPSWMRKGWPRELRNTANQREKSPRGEAFPSQSEAEPCAMRLVTPLRSRTVTPPSTPRFAHTWRLDRDRLGPQTGANACFGKKQNKNFIGTQPPRDFIQR